MSATADAQCIAQNIYITGVDDSICNSALILAIMEMLAGHAGACRVFRPIAPAHAASDAPTCLLQGREPAEPIHYGCDSEQAGQLLAAGQYQELLKRILEQYRDLQEQHEHILCLGSDFGGGSQQAEFEFNSDLAYHFGCLLLPVISARGLDAERLLEHLASLKHNLAERKCELLTCVVNQIPPEHYPELQTAAAALGDFPLALIPTDPNLEHLTLDNIAQALAATVLAGGDALHREAGPCKIAAMQAPEFLDRLADGDLIIAPGDRMDILLACLVSQNAKSFPQIAGLLLTEPAPDAPRIQKLLHSLEQPRFPILAVAGDALAAALQVGQTLPRLDPKDQRKTAKALGFIENHLHLFELKQRLCAPSRPKMTPLMFEYELLQRAKANPRHIVLPEGEEERILRAAEILLYRRAVTLTLLGDETVIRRKIKTLDLKLNNIAIIDPQTSPWRDEFAEIYYQARKHKNISLASAYDLMGDVSYFGTLMIQRGYADGMVSGAVHSTQHTIRPAFEIIKTRPGVSLVSSVFLMCMPDRVLVFGDCAVNPNPDAEQLADIAISAAATAQKFNIEPKIAMLSYATGDSGKGEAVDKVRLATQIAKQLRPDLKIDGPIQYDAAVDRDVAHTKLPDSEVAGQASVFIFPDLNTGNNTYKAVQRAANAVAIGPILQGLNKPVNDLSRGCTVADIVNTVIITAIQAQEHISRAAP